MHLRAVPCEGWEWVTYHQFPSVIAGGCPRDSVRDNVRAVPIDSSKGVSGRTESVEWQGLKPDASEKEVEMMCLDNSSRKLDPEREEREKPSL